MQFYCKRAYNKSITLFSELEKNLINFDKTRTCKNENVELELELELAKQAELELELELDTKIDRVRSPDSTKPTKPNSNIKTLALTLLI